MLIYSDYIAIKTQTRDLAECFALLLRRHHHAGEREPFAGGVPLRGAEPGASQEGEEAAGPELEQLWGDRRPGLRPHPRCLSKPSPDQIPEQTWEGKTSEKVNEGIA